MISAIFGDLAEMYLNFSLFLPFPMKNNNEDLSGRGIEMVAGHPRESSLLVSCSFSSRYPLSRTFYHMPRLPGHTSSCWAAYSWIAVMKMMKTRIEE